jgi:hypothetical protein
MFVAEEVASGNKLFSYDACKLLNLGCNCSLQTEELLIHLKGDKKNQRKKKKRNHCEIYFINIMYTTLVMVP